MIDDRDVDPGLRLPDGSAVVRDGRGSASRLNIFFRLKRDHR